MTIFDRLLGRDKPTERKAVSGGVWLSSLQNGPSLSSMQDTWHKRAQAYLAAYRVGWFYKAGSRISSDFANLSWTLAYEDSEGDNEEDIVAAPGNVPFDRLDPLEQFLRLSERPNPYQSGRIFKAQQMVRLDFTGRAIIYVEDADATGLPTALYGINPARMHKSLDRNGRLIGWVMDPDAPSGGVPFTADEIIAVEYPGADNDPQGVVDAVYQYAQLSPMIPQHTADVLSTGGRLAGMAWPKERSLSEDEFVEAQRAWRNVTSDPNAARRLLLFPEPMEFQQGASTPAEIGLPELALLARDEILSAFPVHPYMVGVPLAAGLNSGESLRYVRKEYWEGTQHPRVEVWEDALQQALIPRYEKAVGRPLDLDIEEPNLDDAGALIEKAAALRALASLGFDEKEAVSAAGLDHIKFNGIPIPEPTATPGGADASGGASVVVQDTSQSDRTQTSQRLTKAQDDPSAERDALMLPIRGRVERSLATFLDAQRERIIARLSETFPVAKAARKALPDDWWDPDVEEAELRRAMNELYVSIGRAAGNLVANRLGRVVFPGQIEAITDAILQDSGASITGILDTTRTAVADALTEGVRRGYSLTQIIDGVPAEGFGGIRNVTLANGIPAFDEYRAEMIARTETAQAFNLANLTGYREFNVREVQAIDGDTDADCAARNGRTYSLDEAFGIGDHPNGTLDWVPITKSVHRASDAADRGVMRDLEVMRELFALRGEIASLKSVQTAPAPVFNITNTPPAVTVEPASVVVTTPDVHVTMPEQQAPVVNITNIPPALPEQAAPVVNITNIPPAVSVEPASITVTSPDVHVAAPEVNVAPATVNVNVPEQPAPIVNVTNEAAKAVEVQDVRLVDSILPPRERTVHRDRQGRVERITDH